MSKVEIGAKIATIIAAMIAVVVFIMSVSDDRNDRLRNRVDTWRKAAIQKVFQKDDDYTLTISDLLTQMKSLAWDDPNLDIGKDELNEDKIRVLLLEMISMEVIYQNKGDTYELRFQTKMTSDTDEAFSEVIVRTKKFEEALEKLRNNPDIYSRDSFYNNFVKDIPMSRVEYDTNIDLMIKMKRIRVNEKDKMRLVTSQDK